MTITVTKEAESHTHTTSVYAETTAPGLPGSNDTCDGTKHAPTASWAFSKHIINLRAQFIDGTSSKTWVLRDITSGIDLANGNFSGSGTNSIQLIERYETTTNRIGHTLRLTCVSSETSIRFWCRIHIQSVFV